MLTTNMRAQNTKVSICPNDTIRIKVTNRCPFQCSFCHHEGNDSARDLILDGRLIDGFKKFYSEMHITQAHLTGGEPTSYRFITDLVRELKTIGYTVKMTSNGQFHPTTLSKLKDAGLACINFSIHTLNPAKLGMLQSPARNEKWGYQALQRQLENLRTARALVIDVKINSVAKNESDVLNIINFCKQEGFRLRLLDDLNDISSKELIKKVLESMHATITRREYTENSSSYTEHFITADGFEVGVKAIRENTLKTLCKDCRKKDVCNEWFYGIRIEQGPKNAQVRLCIERQDYPAVQSFSAFFESRQCKELQRHHSIFKESGLNPHCKAA